MAIDQDDGISHSQRFNRNSNRISAIGRDARDARDLAAPFQTDITTDIGNFFKLLMMLISSLWNRDFHDFNFYSELWFPSDRYDDSTTVGRNVGRMRTMRDEAIADPSRRFSAAELARLTEGLEHHQLTAMSRKMILDMIGGVESDRGYNNAQGNRSVPFTTMSVGQAMQWQIDNKRYGETQAIGRYQFMPDTLGRLVSQYNIPLDKPLDEAMQDRLANHLMDERGYRRYMAGEIPSTTFMFNLSQEWAGLPKDSSGLSYYDGVGSNKAHISASKTVETLIKAKQVKEVGDGLTQRGAEAPKDNQDLTGLRITKRFDESLPYGKTATQEKENFSGIVLHTAGKPTLDQQLAYMASPDPNRNNKQFGYHYVIDKNGDVYQTAPEGKRTNHIMADQDPSFKNSNSIGVALITNGGEPTEAQKVAALKLTSGLQGQYGIDKDRIVSHGDIQTDRDHVDRGGHSEGHEVIAYIKENGADTAATTTVAAAVTNKGPKVS